MSFAHRAEWAMACESEALLLSCLLRLLRVFLLLLHLSVSTEFSFLSCVSLKQKNARHPNVSGTNGRLCHSDHVVKNSKGLQRKLPTEDLIVSTNTVVSVPHPYYPDATVYVNPS